jgi:hypothetical protein
MGNNIVISASSGVNKNKNILDIESGLTIGGIFSKGVRDIVLS